MKDIFKQAFAISKIDEEKQMVYGVVSGPDLDTQDEVVPPALMQAAMPSFMQRGNLREMHNHIAAGKVKDWQMNDQGETEIAAKVVDPISWLKVKEGVLTGFSIGGSGTTKVEMMNGRPVKVYQDLALTEISLVDSPAYPKANITLWKAHGLTQKGTNKMEVEIQEELASAGAGLEKLAKASTSKTKKATKAPVKVTAKAAPKKATRKADDSSDDSGDTDETADAPDLTSDQIVQAMLAVHNAMVMAGNMDGASGITDAIACFQAAQQDQAADDAGDMDDDGDVMMDDDSGDMMMADDTTDNNDDITDDQEDDANTGPDFSLKADDGQGADDTDDVDGDGSDDQKPDTDADKARKRKAAKGKQVGKALTLRGAGSYRGLMAKVAAHDPERESAIAKAVSTNFSKVLGVLEGFEARIAHLEGQPRAGGPAVRAVDKALVGGAGAGANGGMTEVQALHKAMESTSDPFLKTKLREEIAVAETRTMYNFTDR